MTSGSDPYPTHDVGAELFFSPLKLRLFLETSYPHLYTDDSHIYFHSFHLLDVSEPNFHLITARIKGIDLFLHLLILS
jgi:hypothetical protein